MSETYNVATVTTEIQGKLNEQSFKEAGKKGGKKAAESAAKEIEKTLSKSGSRDLGQSVGGHIAEEISKGIKKNAGKSFAMSEQIAHKALTNPAYQQIHMARMKDRLSKDRNYSADLSEVFSQENLSKFVLSHTQGEGIDRTTIADLDNAFSDVTDQIANSATIGEKFGTVLSSIPEHFKLAAKYAKEFGTVIASIAKGVAKVAVSTGKVVWNVSKAIYNATPLSKIISGVSKLTKKLSTLSKQLVRIATYRAIRWLLKQMTTGFKTGISNAYQWAKIVGEKFAPAMDSLATSAQYVQNSLGALSANIIEDFSAAISAAMDKIAQLISMLSKFYSLLIGKEYYYAATKSLKQFAQTASKTLLGFDELNVLGSGSDSDYSSMFEKVAVEAEETVPTLQGVADKINSIIDGIDVEGIASKIGKTVNKITRTINNFVGEIDFKKIGKKLSDGFDELIDTISPDTLGEAISQKINIVVGLVEGFVENFNWSKAGTWLANLLVSWFDSINWDGLEKTISGAINGVFTFIGSFLTNVDWAKKAEFLATKLNETIKLIDWEKVGSTINTFIKGLFESMIAFVNAIDWAAVGKAVGDCISSIDWVTVFTDCLRVIWAAFKAAVTVTTTGLASTLEGLSSKYQQFVSGDGWYYTEANGYKTTDYWKKYYGAYASGGTPSTGSLFLAGEAGPELVTQIGGRSTVFNEEQLGSSMAIANESVVQAILTSANALISAVNRKDTTVELDGTILSRKLYSYTNKENTRRGTSLIQGV